MMAEFERGTQLTVEIEDMAYPNMGLAYEKDTEIRVKDSWPGQKLRVKIIAVHADHYQAKIEEVIEPADYEREEPLCDHLDLCGGCREHQRVAYSRQVRNKELQMKNLLSQADLGDYNWLGVEPSPQAVEYRNNMEFSFGDLEKGGELQLGMHLPGRMYEVVTVDTCQLVDEDFRQVLREVVNYLRGTDLKKYHIKRREGFLRHLVVRKGLHTGQLLVNLVTTSQREHDFTELTARLTDLDYEGELVGFLQTINDDYADAVKCDQLITHYGQAHYWEELLGLKFKVTPFSFFQTNSYGAERLYAAIRNWIGSAQDKVVYDLYCGTGTIAQLVAPAAEKVIGIEVVEEAVETARANSKVNGLTNCRFIAGRVREELAAIEEEPELIILDPPRAGLHPDARQAVIDYGCPEVIYVSCNPAALVEDLEAFSEAGYQVDKIKGFDMFPHTPHIENCAHLKMETGN